MIEYEKKQKVYDARDPELKAQQNRAWGAIFPDGFEVRGVNAGSTKRSVSEWISSLNLG